MPILVLIQYSNSTQRATRGFIFSDFLSSAAFPAGYPGFAETLHEFIGLICGKYQLGVNVRVFFKEMSKILFKFVIVKIKAGVIKIRMPIRWCKMKRLQ